MNGKRIHLIKDRGVCPFPHKRSFVSKGDAKTYRDKNPKQTMKDELQIYHCECGLYHFTTMSRDVSRNPKIKHGVPPTVLNPAFKAFLKNNK